MQLRSNAEQCGSKPIDRTERVVSVRRPGTRTCPYAESGRVRGWCFRRPGYGHPSLRLSGLPAKQHHSYGIVARLRSRGINCTCPNASQMSIGSLLGSSSRRGAGATTSRLYNVRLDQPTGEWKRTWKVALTSSRLERRWHDLRHTVITRLCESPTVGEETIRSLAGHVSQQMRQRYSHVKSAAKLGAIAELEKALGGDRGVQKRAQNEDEPASLPHGSDAQNEETPRFPGGFQRRALRDSNSRPSDP